MKITRTSKANHYNNFFKENKLNLLKTWDGIREIINIKKSETNYITSLKLHDKTVTDSKTIANTFNDHFTSIAKNIEQNLITSTYKFSDYLTDPYQQTFFLAPTEEKEVLTTIKLLKRNKATGPSSIPTKFLKLFQKELSKPIALIINMSFTTGKFPAILKIAKVMPFYKKGDPTLCNNYRPISLLSNLGKIIETLVHKRITDFLNQQNILYEKQFGFRKNHSTSHALTELTEKIRHACDQGKFACGVFLDFQKAFDTVNHDILLKKLEYYGVRGVSNNWLKSYLKDRKQHTCHDGVLSDNKHNEYGVPQGSVLGPLLFIIFINDFHQAIKSSAVHHFADDTNLLLIDKSLKKINKYINKDLKYATDWIRANKLSLNTSKTEIILFKTKNKVVTKHLNFRVSGQKIELSKSVKYLGITIQDDLYWNLHLSQLTKKLNRSIGLLSKIRHYVPKYLLRTIYYAIFNSHLIYGCEIWGQDQNNTLFRNLIKLQEKALKIINFKRFDEDANILFKDNKILKISDFITYKNLLFVRNSLKKENISLFNDLFLPLNTNHNHNTRAKNLLDIPQTHTTHFGDNSIRNKAVRNWNTVQRISNNDLLTCDFNEFKKEIYNIYYNNY